MEKLDKATEEALHNAEKWKFFVDGEHWQEIKGIFFEHIDGLKDVMTIQDKTSLVQEVGARQLAIESILTVIGVIEGKAAQYENNLTLRSTGGMPVYKSIEDQT